MPTYRTYHGSNSAPFEQFDPLKCGSGVVGSRYKGCYFFTSSQDNAEFYTDAGGHIALWELDLERPIITDQLPCVMLRDGIPLNFDEDGEPCDWDEQPDGIVCQDVLDGHCYSEVIVIWDESLARRIEVVQEIPLCVD